jgi:CheY-like chemotaxis protein
MRGRLWLTIADQGLGFDPKTVERTGGFGLLSIRERIELLGGRMRVRSAKGQGSVFVIVLPDGQMTQDKGPTAQDILDPSRVVRHPSSGPILRVLLADDHKVMREGLAALLKEQTDMEVVAQAGNGREAVNLTCELQPDVVIMDIAMPLMSGDEATRQIKIHAPKTRVIALSMFEEAGVAEAARNAGAERYLLKTAPFEELLNAIRGQAC